MNKKKIILIFFVLVIGYIIIFSYNISTDKRPVKQNNIITEKEDNTINNENIRKESPSIEIDQGSYDFGVVKYGDIVKHIFKLTNKGSEDLEIFKLSTSCGCTKASVADEDNIISPGESVEMLVTFDPAVHKDNSDLGNLKRIIYIKTNDPENDEIEAEITANVLSPEKFKTINVTAERWFFDPDPIEVNEGDYVELKITSKDTNHGFALPDFGIEEMINPGEETVIKFLADKKGSFEFYCSVPCGGGHSSMRGTLIIK